MDSRVEDWDQSKESSLEATGISEPALHGTEGRCLGQVGPAAGRALHCSSMGWEQSIGIINRSCGSETWGEIRVSCRKRAARLVLLL